MIVLLSCILRIGGKKGWQGTSKDELAWGLWAGAQLCSQEVKVALAGFSWVSLFVMFTRECCKEGCRYR